MPRRARPSGGPLPRARAKRRGPRDRSHAEAEDEADFNAQIEAWLELEERREHLHTLDLRAFVQQCPHPRHGPGERLRRLAIFLDDRVDTWRPTPLQEWELLGRIYDEAERFAPASPDLFHARAVSAVELAWWRPADDPARARLMAISRAAAQRGLALDEQDLELHYMAGYTAYMDAPSDKLVALEHFEQVRGRQPRHARACLYRAHCLHDLGRWHQAAAAYAELESCHFTPRRAWRLELSREQRAFCLWRGGAHDVAGELFEQLMTRREQLVRADAPRPAHPMLHELPVYLSQAAASGEFGAELLERLRAHLELLDALWLLERDQDAAGLTKQR